MLAVVALVAMVLSVLIGLSLLTGLLRGRRPLPLTVLVHLVVAAIALAAWTTYVVGDDRAWLAWAVFALLLLINTLGDQLMLQGWRARAVREGRTVPTGTRLYLAAARDTLSFARPTAAVHALLAPVSFFGVLLVALGVGD